LTGFLFGSIIVAYKEQTMSRMFWELAVKRMFRLNGNDYIKQSTRTARMLSNGRVFYIGQKEVVHPIAW
jgi:hypothetical protein